MPAQLVQINIARARGPMDTPVMAEFVNALDEVNALAESSPGFVWRFKTGAGHAIGVQSYPDPLIFINLLKQGVPAVQVAQDLGFADQAHLTRVFKQRVAATPGQYHQSRATPRSRG